MPNRLAENTIDKAAWNARIGDAVKFADEQAVFEAFHAGTEYPFLYYGTLESVFIIKIYQGEILYARIKPRWSDDIQYIPTANVRFVE